MGSCCAVEAATVTVVPAPSPGGAPSPMHHGAPSMDSNGGTMSITGTTTGQGAFSAALSEVKSAEELQALQVMSDHASGRVLLVDTDEQSAQQAREWIERSFHGVTVTVARSFQQAVAEVQEDVRAAAKEGAGASATNDVAGHLTPPSSPGIRKPHHYFDVVLLDYSLVSEEENKIAELQRYGKSHILPIVAMVTSVQPAVIAHLVSHGAHDFVLKPLHRLLLLSRVHAVISGNRVERMRNAHATLMAIRDAKIAQLQEQARKWHKKAMKYNRQLNASSLPE